MATVSTTETGVYRDKADYFVNGKMVINATILRQKGRVRARVAGESVGGRLRHVESGLRN